MTAEAARAGDAGACRPLAANSAARRVLGGALTQGMLLQILVSQTFRKHSVNYDEVVRALAPVGPHQNVAAVSGNGHLDAYRVLLETLAKTEPAGVAHLQELWQTAPDASVSTRATFPVLWRAETAASSASTASSPSGATTSGTGPSTGILPTRKRGSGCSEQRKNLRTMCKAVWILRSKGVSRRAERCPTRARG
ncbi:MAG: hypothetical protein ACR2PL_20330 [Dehalococcoidia bacterium]